MAGGYIKLYRKIREHWVWQNAEYLKWWLDILLLANHQPQKIPINGTLKIIDTGEHHTSETKLAKRWFVNRKTVDKFLKMLEKDEMIFIEKSRQNGTTLKVLNYKAYQAFIDSDMDNEKDNGGTTARTSKGHRKDINKNLNNKTSLLSEPATPLSDDKEIGIVGGGRKKPHYEPDSVYYKAAKWLASAIERRIDGYKPISEVQLQSWANEARLMIENDKRDLGLTNKLLVFSQTDSFWSGNILSMGKFRKQYDTLLAKYPKDKGSGERQEPYAGYKDLRDYL